MPDTNIPRPSFRVYRAPDGKPLLDFIDSRGAVVGMVMPVARRNLPEGYYTPQFKLIRLTPRSLGA